MRATSILAAVCDARRDEGRDGGRGEWVVSVVSGVSVVSVVSGQVSCAMTELLACSAQCSSVQQ